MIPISQSKCFSSPSLIYYKNSNPRQSKYYTSLALIYHKINPSPVSQLKYFLNPYPIYHKIDLSPKDSPRFLSKFNDLLKLNLKIPELYVTLMNDFDKIFALAFYNFFPKIKLNCDKKICLFKVHEIFKQDVV